MVFARKLQGPDLGGTGMMSKTFMESRKLILIEYVEGVYLKW